MPAMDGVPITPRTRMPAVIVGSLACLAILSPAIRGQQTAGAGTPSLAEISPTLHNRLIAIDRAQGVLYGALVAGGGTVDEGDVRRRMMRRLTDLDAVSRPDPEAERGFAALGARGAEIVRGAHAFHRDVAAASIVTPYRARRQALDAVVRQYRSRRTPSLPDAPKDMTILYDHPYTSFVAPEELNTEPSRQLRYPTLTGTLWAAHWFELAILTPLESFSDPIERERALEEVAQRFLRKLAEGKPPDAYPLELPLAPAIAPGLVSASERAASIVDNLNMMLDVLMDVLVHPDVPDRQAAVEDVFTQFTDRQYRCVRGDEWVLVALRHSIFAQGGPAMGGMNEFDRNAFSGNHGQHYGPRRAPPPCEPE